MKELKIGIGTVVRLKGDSDSDLPVVVRTEPKPPRTNEFLGWPTLVVSSLCVSECGNRVVWAKTDEMEPVNPTADFALEVIKEVAEFVGSQRNDTPACGFEFEASIKHHAKELLDGLLGVYS